MRGKDGRITGWKAGRDSLSWFGHFKATGTVEVRLDTGAVEKPVNWQVTWSARQGDGKAESRGVSSKPGDTTMTLGHFTVTQPGYYRLNLAASGAEGETLPDLKTVAFDGPGAAGAHFSTVERRNAASVHLGYPVPETAKDAVEWFYCELTPREEPTATYYEACGWHRGYFGMQVNSPTERRLIFSVWDSGGEAVDRNKVAAEHRVTLVAKGDGVHAGDFGNEGTGGHSHLVYPWKNNQTFRFLLHAKPDGNATTYSGWFFFPEKNAWGLIATFRAPNDGKTPRGLYSFNENFGGGNGHLRRLCEFGNQWIRTDKGEWLPLLEARFTHDGHGREQRLDRSAGVIGDRFYLSNGGFVTDPNPQAVTKAYDRLVRPKGDGKPPEKLPE